MAIGNNYEYLIADFSYIVSRNVFAASKGKKVGEYTAGDVIRITIQTMNKLARDFNIRASKIIFLADKWDKGLDGEGYIRHWILKDYVPYKGTRTWMTEKIIADMKKDPRVTEEELEKAELELYQNQVKFKAKQAMTDDFKYLGMPVFSIPGYEADDLAWISSCLLYGKTGGKKSVFVTKDSDWQYFLNPEMDFFKIPTNGSEPEFITYEQKLKEIPQFLKDRGMNLYMYNAYKNSLGISHNDNLKTLKPGITDYDQVILHILDGDYSEISDIPAFRAQMRSFDVQNFPRFDEAQNLVTDHFAFDGTLGDISIFHNFCSKYGITQITDRYYSDFICRFDQDLYKEKLL